MDRLLITGATGFIGKWVLRHWRTAHPDVEIWATSNQPDCLGTLADRFSLLDLRDADAVRELICTCKPTQVIHLAGLVARAPLADYLAVNVVGTENLYDALSELDGCQAARIVQAGTAAVYGPVTPDELPVSEEHALRPLTPYAMSKMAQDSLAEMFWRTRSLQVIRARIFNLMGAGQPDYLVPATFIRQLKAIHDGEAVQVGDLTARRDLVDVRDIVVAFDKLLTHGRAGAAYNVGSGTSVAIREVLEELLRISGFQHRTTERESMRIRKNDVPDIYADITAITGDTGWRPQVCLRDALQAMWDDVDPNGRDADEMRTGSEEWSRG